MSDDGISEAVSEKRKRGRPPTFTPEYRALMKAFFPDVQTRRGMTNVLYQQQALGLLRDDARFKWLVDKDKMIAGEPNAWKPSILAELGRISDEETLKVVALRVCEVKPKTKDAIAEIRRFRTGKTAAGNASDLYSALATRMNDYIQQHPGMPLSEVDDAVLALLGSVQEQRIEA
jgi:hypothetical protein|tara:strand:+ start:210 stop:734 length:525 start_codon:yes stop_codon:yes gene_type:complete